MTAYNPHELQQVDYIDEIKVVGRGRLVKVRFPDQPAPNVGWTWIPTGNCMACRYMAHSIPGRTYPACLNAKITTEEFFDKYVWTNDCPEFKAGIEDRSAQAESGLMDILDTMKAIGMVPGKPSQQVKILVNEPWSITLSQRAHREMCIFLDMAHYADYLLTHPGANDPSRGEYVDLSDDLERPVVAAP